MALAWPASAKQASSIISKKEEEEESERGEGGDRGGCLAQMTSSAKMMNGGELGPDFDLQRRKR